MIPPELFTQRLLLYPALPELDMVTSEYFHRNRDFFQPYLPELPHDFFTLKAQRERLDRQYAAMKRGEELRWLAFHRSDKSQTYILGDVCFTQIVYGVQQSAVVGYQVDGRAARQGVASEMLRTALDFVFQERKLHRIEALILPANEASRRLAEKFGFQNEGVARKLLKIKGIWEDHLRYSLLSENWS